MHDEQFVDRVCKGGDAISKLRQKKPIQLERSASIGAIHEKPFGRRMASKWVSEVKAEILATVAQAPSTSRVKKGALAAGRNAWKPLHLDVYVRATALDSKGLVLSINHYSRSVTCGDS